MKDSILIVIFVALFMLSLSIILYFDTIINSPAEIPVEIRDVTVEDIQLLIDRARVSGNLELESILHAVAGALETKTLSELADYTTKYSKHMLEDHFKSDKSVNKLNTI